MKDVKVYDGSGWQSIKGPPGPSEPSRDLGNAITTGSDGLLFVAEPQGEVMVVEATMITFDGWVNASVIEGVMEVRSARSGRAVEVRFEFTPASQDTLILLPTQSTAFAYGLYQDVMARAVYAIDKDEADLGKVSKPPAAMSLRYIRETSIRLYGSDPLIDAIQVHVPNLGGYPDYADHKIVLWVKYAEAA